MKERRAAPTVAAVVALAFILWWFAGPRPSFVSSPGQVTWSGGTCLNLEIDQTDTWVRVASAELSDAIGRNWNAPRDWTTCGSDQVADVVLTIPNSFDPGLYRICDGETLQCLEVRHAP